MQNQVEEIVLLSTKDGEKHRNTTDVFNRVPTRSDRFKQLFKTTNRSFVYKNLLLWVVLFACLFILVVPLALHLSYALPKVRSRTIPLHEFSEERARDFYPNLTEHGPRVANTQGDYQTREFLLSQISRIRSMAKPLVQVEINAQNFSEASVGQLQNIAVRLFNANSSPNTSCLLLLAHYDSVEFSPGGGDDGSGVVTLLELLSNLVMDPEIIFSQVHLIVLFTAGEELGQKGAEAFVANHPWNNNIRRFINIDSYSGQEKAILFRVKPSQLVHDYRHVPRPHANVIGDEIFNYIGSDTDYTTMITKGSLLGYDFAFYLDGYHYHTSNDYPSIIKAGALQHLGENTLVLVRRILLGKVDLQQPETIIDEENIIYFDVLGRHLVTYRKTTSVIVQSILIGLIVLIGLVVIILDHIWSRKNPSVDDFNSIYFYFKHPLLVRLCSILIFFVCYIVSMFIGIFFPILIAFIISKFRPMSWYGNATLAFFLYGLICLIGMILCESLWTIVRRCCLLKYAKKNPMEIKAIHHIDRLCFNFERHWALLLVFVLLMSIDIYFGYRSLYLILVWSIFICPIYSLLILFEFTFRWLKKSSWNLFNEQGWYWLLAPYLVSLIPLIHTLEMTSRLTRMTIPMMSRIVYITFLPQDLIISTLVAIPAMLFFLIFIPNAQRMMNYSRTLIILMISFLIVLIIACFRPPYTSTHPKIISVQHQSTTKYYLTNPQTFPMIIPIHSQIATTNVISYDNLLLSPFLDEFTRKSGYELTHRSCRTYKCVFDDTFNRTIAFKEVELVSIDASKKYRFIIRHLPSDQITIAPSIFADVILHNTIGKPRTETILDVVPLFNSSFFDFKMTIERCDFNDSPFVLILTKTLPSIVLWGMARCQAFADTLRLTVDQSR